MTFDALLGVALDLAYFAIFGFTLIDWLRHRDPVRRAVVLMFASLATVLAAPLLRTVIPGLGGVVAVAIVPALIAQPLLALWIVDYLRPIPRLAIGLALASFVGLVASFLLLAAGGAASGSPLVSLLAIALLGYFLVLEGAAAVGFALAARDRAGASRSRLLTAAVATALLGMAVVVLLGSGLAAGQNTPAQAAINAFARVVALVAAFGYLAAFAPPAAMRRLSQQGIVYDFIRDLNALPSGSSVDQIWNLLEDAAERASGGRVSVVPVPADAPVAADEPAAPDGRIVTLPFPSQRWPTGRLELTLGRHALFLDDDLQLMELLLDRSVRAAERESFLLERERMIAELQAASDSKSDFLAAMSHELRTPLNAIIGFSELLTADDEPNDQATVTTYAEHIHGSGLHLLELVNDVLDLARVEAGRLDLKPARVELADLVRQTVAQVQPLADQKRLGLKLELADVAIEADPSRFRQIVINLLSNAIKFTDDGGEIRVCLEDDHAGSARLTVADTGRGIAAADLERIFEAFHQGDSGGAAPQEGTGLGLALTRQLVEAHGGRIAVTSEVGAGSQFTVVLPLPGTTPAGAAEPAPAFPEGRPRVLVIEDDLAARELLRLYLEAAGYGVLATASGREGLAWLSELRPDAVLLDILLPDLDGWEILHQAKSDPRTRSIPIMVVSIVDDRQLGLALGAVDYIVKPVPRERLLEALGKLTFTTKVRSRTVTALVIDGDPLAPRRFRELLEPDGFRVIHAPDGASGRRAAVEERPDLILLDAVLPDLDGFGLIQALRSDPATAAIPIWLTAPTGLAPEAKARLTGNVQGVLSRGDDALAALRGWLETGKVGA